ncbi:MAG: 2-C-methyl-D-erythritol 4-phosphate cytidylyltransferase [Acidaminococcaceae bacterium]|nr:2-C-methyl-D-erythritol 4-phosphate cytidylyltransferase [Acidaminococcaceae bacterium]
MVIGVLLAGGIGRRMGTNIPKQFLNVMGKPIVYYPLNIMEQHSQIDAIEIVCVESYIDEMLRIVKKYNFRKVKWITPGGDTCQESTWNGLNNLKKEVSDEDIVLIHMTSYPLAGADIISGCIESAIVNGNGCTARPILYSVYFTNDKKTATEQIDRDKLMLCTVPYAFRFGECSRLYDKAFAERKGISGNVFTNTLYCDYGKRIFFTKDSQTNLKVTTPEDIKLMEMFLKVMEGKD